MLTSIDRLANAEADRLAKLAAEAGRLADDMRQRVAKSWHQVVAVATWIGQITVIASEYQLSDGSVIRDAAPRSRQTRQPNRGRAGMSVHGPVQDDARKACTAAMAAPGPRPLDECPRWVALLERVRQRERDAQRQQELGLLAGEEQLDE